MHSCALCWNTPLCSEWITDRGRLGRGTSHWGYSSDLGCPWAAEGSLGSVSNLHLHSKYSGKLCHWGICSGGIVQARICISVVCSGNLHWIPSWVYTHLLPKGILSCRESCIPIWTDLMTRRRLRGRASRYIRTDALSSSSFALAWAFV